MTETTANPQAQTANPANAANPANSAPPKDITGAEALAMVRAEKERLANESNSKPVDNSTETTPPNENAIKNAAQEALRKFKVKVDGEELEVDEDELKRGYSHQKAANKIFQQGLTARRQAEEFIAMMKDPQKFYETAEKLGHDPRKLAEDFLASKLEDELLDPKDKELKRLQRELEQRDKKMKEEEEAQKAKVLEGLKAKYAKEYSDQFIAALEQTGLPPTKPMVAEMAKYISRAAQMNFKMTAQEAAQLVKEDVAMAHARLIKDLDGDKLINLLGEETASKIRKYDVSKIKNPEHNLKTPVEQNTKPKERAHTLKRMSPKEWREFNRKL